MLENSNGKLLVYASDLISCEKRFSSVSGAVEKIAKLLRLNFEVVTCEEEVVSIYVYYKNGEEDPVPIYCDKGEDTSVEEVYSALRSMMFVLSFHPRYSALKYMRKRIMRFS
ncbi:hypothetical protein HXY32_06525 [Candidatus Bathyarchaeota archaeon]|nr:hypothetical protein [Candidatus Bathyarchaeota archaeon]